jgi:hypothetical protein
LALPNGIFLRITGFAGLNNERGFVMAGTTNTAVAGAPATTFGVNANFVDNGEFTVSPYLARTDGNGNIYKVALQNFYNSKTEKISFKPSAEITKAFSNGSNLGASVSIGPKNDDITALLKGTQPTGNGSSVASSISYTFGTSETKLDLSAQTPIGNNETLAGNVSLKNGKFDSAGITVTDPVGTATIKLNSKEEWDFEATSKELKDSDSGWAGKLTFGVKDILGDDMKVELGATTNASGQSPTTATLVLPEKAPFLSSALADLLKNPNKITAPNASEQPYGEGSGLKIDSSKLEEYFPILGNDGETLFDAEGLKDGIEKFWDALSSDNWDLEGFIEEFVPSSLSNTNSPFDSDSPPDNTGLSDIDSLLPPDDYMPVSTGETPASSAAPAGIDDGETLFDADGLKDSIAKFWDALNSDNWDLEEFIEEFVPSSLTNTNPPFDSDSSSDNTDLSFDGFLEKLIPGLSGIDSLLSPDGYLPPADTGSSLDDAPPLDTGFIKELIPSFTDTNDLLSPDSYLPPADTGSSLNDAPPLDTGFIKELIPSFTDTNDLLSPDSYLPPADTGSSFDTNSTSSLFDTNSTSSLFDTNSTSSLFDTNSTSSLFDTNSTSSLFDTNSTSSLFDTGSTSSLFDTNSTSSLFDTGSTSSLFDTNSTSSLFDTNLTSSLFDTGSTSSLFDTNSTSSLFDTGSYNTSLSTTDFASSFDSYTPSFDSYTPSFDSYTPSFDSYTPSFDSYTPSFDSYASSSFDSYSGGSSWF